MHDGKECRIENAVFGSRTSRHLQSRRRPRDVRAGDPSQGSRDAELTTGTSASTTCTGASSVITPRSSRIRSCRARHLAAVSNARLRAKSSIAEEGATFSFPEVLFNMFPGMGALSLLGRRIGLKKAEDIIMSGKVFTAREMFELGVVDEVAADGAGFDAPVT